MVLFLFDGTLRHWLLQVLLKKMSYPLVMTNTAIENDH